VKWDVAAIKAFAADGAYRPTAHRLVDRPFAVYAPSRLSSFARFLARPRKKPPFVQLAGGAEKTSVGRSAVLDRRPWKTIVEAATVTALAASLSFD
jgi:hypothetical protein